MVLDGRSIGMMSIGRVSIGKMTGKWMRTRIGEMALHDVAEPDIAGARALLRVEVQRWDEPAAAVSNSDRPPVVV
ncbi:MAG TPA: hypothetical protein VFE99_00785, partial [Agromyces sp.]|nr:hypothetical protein [Agromyces sp.]